MLFLWSPQKVGWQVKLLSYTPAEAGGYKEVIAQVCA
jgi:protein subunit release factor A